MIPAESSLGGGFKDVLHPRNPIYILKPIIFGYVKFWGRRYFAPWGNNP